MLNKKFALKVKIKSLAAETRIIKSEMRARKDVGTKISLRSHHVNVVRPEARHSQLAYAFLKNKEYYEVERSCVTPPDFAKIWTLVERFGETWDYWTVGSWESLKARRLEQQTKFSAWKTRATSHLSTSQKVQ